MSRVRGELTAGSCRRPWLVAVLTSLCFGAALAVGGGTVAGSVPDGQFVHGNSSTDSAPPTIANVSRADDTAITLTVTDNHDVDESTVEAGDFVLSDGSLTGVAVAETGSNATVTLELASALDVENVTVAVADDASIADTNGNVVDADSAVPATVTGMDSVQPEVVDFSVSDATGGPTRIAVEATEELVGIDVIVDGPDTTTLRRSDFRETSASTYAATYRPEADGQYDVALRGLTDTGGNENLLFVPRQMFADRSPPETVAGIDVAASNGLTFAFDGDRSSDPSGIANYTWSFGDGTSATGQRTTHTFTPGNYTVTLRATDEYGNVGTDTLVLNLSESAGNVTDTGPPAGSSVSIDRGGGSATVSVVRATPDSPVEIDGAEPLVTRDNVTLSALRVNVTRETSFDLAIDADGPDAVAGVGADRRTLGGVTVVHAVPEETVANATVRFRVAPAALAALDAGPRDVSLYRHQDGGWTELPTSPINATDQFRARSPGLSRFAVAAAVSADNSSVDNSSIGNASAGNGTATPTPTPTADPETLAVTEIAFNRTSVPPGGAVIVVATVNNTGSKTAAYTAGLSVDGSLVSTRPARVPGGGTSRVQFLYRVDPNATGTLSVAVNGTEGGPLTVGGGDSGLLGVFGFLPLGLLGTILTYVGGPLMAVYLCLKGFALLLGY
jgi:hypothetical protein